MEASCHGCRIDLKVSPYMTVLFKMDSIAIFSFLTTDMEFRNMIYITGNRMQRVVKGTNDFLFLYIHFCLPSMNKKLSKNV